MQQSVELDVRRPVLSSVAFLSPCRGVAGALLRAECAGAGGTPSGGCGARSGGPGGLRGLEPEKEGRRSEEVEFFGRRKAEERKSRQKKKKTFSLPTPTHLITRSGGRATAPKS